MLVLATNGAILLVTDWLFSRTMAVTTTAFTTAVFLALWLALPLARRVTVRNRATRGPEGR